MPGREGGRRGPGWRGLFGPLLLLAALAAGCAPMAPAERREQAVAASAAAGPGELAALAPVFLLEGTEADHNRIGRVAARTRQGRETVAVHIDRPVIYAARFPFATAQAGYTNLVYRIHFPGTPYRLAPFHLGAGRNVGLLVILTLDGQQRLVLVTTANTCGCYAVSIPTSLLPSSALPAGWPEGQVEVFGERLPARLDMAPGRKVVVRVRADVHRVRDLGLAAAGDSIPAGAVPAELADLASLKALPLGNGEHTSFYYQHWPLTGHVKGSVKPWETLLLSLASLDLFIGMDKEYGETQASSTPFFTSLKPWNRQASDLNDFARYLRFNGWSL